MVRVKISRHVSSTQHTTSTLVTVFNCESRRQTLTSSSSSSSSLHLAVVIHIFLASTTSCSCRPVSTRLGLSVIWSSLRQAFTPRNLQSSTRRRSCSCLRIICSSLHQRLADVACGSGQRQLLQNRTISTSVYLVQSAWLKHSSNIKHGRI